MATTRRDARHAQILAAVRAVVREQGIEQATLARVADAGGVPVGLVSHYYRSQEDLLLGAYDAVVEDVIDRIDQLIALGERDDTRVEQLLVDVLAQLLPLSQRRRDEVGLTQAVAEFAVDGDTFDQRVDSTHAQLRRRVAAALEEGKLYGEVDPGIDSDAAALETLHLVDGLAARSSVDASQQSSSWATEQLAEAVAALCPSDSQQSFPVSGKDC